MNKKIIKFSILLAVLAIVSAIAYFSFGIQKSIKRLDVLGVSINSTMEEFNQVGSKWFLQDIANLSDDYAGLSDFKTSVMRDFTIGKYTSTCRGTFKNYYLNELTCMGQYSGEKAKEMRDVWVNGFRAKYGRPIIDEPLRTTWCDEEGNALIIEEKNIHLRKALKHVDCKGKDLTPPATPRF